MGDLLGASPARPSSSLVALSLLLRDRWSDVQLVSFHPLESHRVFRKHKYSQSLDFLIPADSDLQLGRNEAKLNHLWE